MSFADLFEALADFDRSPGDPGAVRRGYAGDLGFYEAVRLLDCESARRSAVVPPRTGEERTTPANEPFRMSQRPTVRFTPNMIAGFDPLGWRDKPELIVTFFGLLGVDGPLPLFLTELVIERMGKDDFLLQRFLDVFHHRFLALYYRAWSEARPGPQGDRLADDRFARRVDMLVGMEAERSRPDARDQKRYFADRFANRVRNPDGLCAMIEEVFAVPAAVEEFVGRLVVDPDKDANRLGHERGILGAMTIGDHLPDCMQTIAVYLGPLDFATYCTFLPGTERLHAFRRAVLDYVGPELDVQVRLILERMEVPGVELNGSARLGLTSWVRTVTLPAHPVTNLY